MSLSKPTVLEGDFSTYTKQWENNQARPTNTAVNWCIIDVDGGMVILYLRSTVGGTASQLWRYNLSDGSLKDQTSFSDNDFDTPAGTALPSAYLTAFVISGAVSAVYSVKGRYVVFNADSLATRQLVIIKHGVVLQRFNLSTLFTGGTARAELIVCTSDGQYAVAVQSSTPFSVSLVKGS